MAEAAGRSSHRRSHLLVRRLGDVPVPGRLAIFGRVALVTLTILGATALVALAQAGRATSLAGLIARFRS
jgi:hypothetical protein